MFKCFVLLILHTPWIGDPYQRLFLEHVFDPEILWGLQGSFGVGGGWFLGKMEGNSLAEEPGAVANFSGSSFVNRSFD